MNLDYLNNVRLEAARHFRETKKNGISERQNYEHEVSVYNYINIFKTRVTNLELIWYRMRRLICSQIF